MTRIRSTCSAALLAAILVANGGSLGATAQQHATAAASTTLIYGAVGDPDSINPMISAGPGWDVIGAVFDSLLSVDAHDNLQPDLATSVTHSADWRTWTFHLRRGVQWADGQSFTSADVAYNYHALFDKKLNVGIATAGWDQIDQSSTPDAYTFVCHLKMVSAPFLANVALTAMIPQHVYDHPGVDFRKSPINRRPIGTGPYMVTEWKTGDHITMVPNPYSWRARPYFQKVIFKIVPDRDTLLVQVRTGEIDMGNLIQRQVSQARALPGKRVVTWLQNNYRHVEFVQYGFLRERTVRQALDYATPKQAIFKGISLGMGAIAIANVSPAVTAYYNPNVPRHPYNLAKAAAMLAADGFVKGADGTLRKNQQPFVMNLWTGTGDSNGERINEILQQVWGQLGIKVTLRTMPYGDLYGPNGPYFTRVMAGSTVGASNNVDVDDSAYWISTAIPKSPTDATCCDSFGYFYRFTFQDQLDALYRAGNLTLDRVKRKAIYFKIQALLADEVPVIFLYWAPYQVVMPSSLTGYDASPFGFSSFGTISNWRMS